MQREPYGKDDFSGEFGAIRFNFSIKVTANILVVSEFPERRTAGIGENVGAGSIYIGMQCGYEKGVNFFSSVKRGPNLNEGKQVTHTLTIPNLRFEKCDFDPLIVYKVHGREVQILSAKSELSEQP